VENSALPVVLAVPAEPSVEQVEMRTVLMVKRAPMGRVGPRMASAPAGAWVASAAPGGGLSLAVVAPWSVP
jgi:hypothetical protein